MTGDSYKGHRDNVIALFKAYKEKRGQLDDGVDINYLEKRVESLKNNKFNLAVAGEVKAGKSTFINALLGTELLPSDVLQASSAIVEIFKSEEPILKVTYANGRKDKVRDDLSKARERLHEICRIRDEYRAIPTTLIDDDIIKSQEDLKITESLIQELEEKSGTNLTGKETLLKEYIVGRTKDNIPVEISFGYPLKWSFNELRIVDSPGVNALGGVQSRAYESFINADAILFVQRITPVELKSFREFVDKVIPNRSKEVLFLVLTRAGDCSDDADIERLHSEAVRFYKDCIPEEQILVVDSLLKMIHDDLKSGKPVEKIRETKEKNKILPFFIDKAENEGRKLIDVVRESSRFGKLEQVIDQFSKKAPKLQLKEILEKIKTGYRNQECQHEEKKERLYKKKRNPQEFEAEIFRLQGKLDEFQLKTNKIKDDLTREYTGKHSERVKVIDAEKIRYFELITSSNTYNSIRKNYMDAINGMQDKTENFSEALRQNLSNKLKKEEMIFQEEHKITMPKVDLDSIEDKAKKSAFKMVSTYRMETESLLENWNLFKCNWTKESRTSSKKTGEKKVYDEEKYVISLKRDCKLSVDKYAKELSSEFKDFLEKYLDSFLKEMGPLIKERKKALEAEKDVKETNNEIIERIEGLEKKKEEIQPELMRVKEILGSI